VSRQREQTQRLKHPQGSVHLNGVLISTCGLSHFRPESQTEGRPTTGIIHQFLDMEFRLKTCVISGLAGLTGAQSVRLFSANRFQVAGIDRDLRRQFLDGDALTEQSRRDLESKITLKHRIDKNLSIDQIEHSLIRVSKLAADAFVQECGSCPIADADVCIARPQMQGTVSRWTSRSS
jgi:hypothetical protein